MSATAYSNLEIRHSSRERITDAANPLRHLRQASVFTGDVAGFMLAVTLACRLLELNLSTQGLLADLVLTVALPVALFCASGLYAVPAISPITEIRKLVCANALAGLNFTLLSIVTLDRRIFAARLLSLLVATLLIAVLRPSIRALLIRSGVWSRPTIIVGTGANADRLLGILKKHDYLGLRPVAVLDNLGPASNRYSDGIIREHISQASVIARRFGISHAIVADPETEVNGPNSLALQLSACFKDIIFIKDCSAIGSLSAVTADIGGLLGLYVSQDLMCRARRISKRLLDTCLVGIAGLLMLPLLVMLYVAVRLSSTGPVFYGQRRIGLHGRYFTAWKFRSMVTNADQVLREHLESNPELRREWEMTQKLRKDPRVLPVGKIMRKTSLDELPQLWNVFRGDMSLVGPRPIVSGEDSRYGDRFDFYKKVRPGITGMWQISGRSNTSYEERVSCDEYYVKNWSVWLDLYILFRTIRTVLLLEGAC